MSESLGTVDLRDPARMLAVLKALLDMADLGEGLADLASSIIGSLGDALGISDEVVDRARLDVVALMEEPR